MSERKRVGMLRLLASLLEERQLRGLPERLYRKLRARAKRNHRSMTQEVTHLLIQALDEPEPLSILELQGLGKELWADIDGAGYIDAERRAWD